MTDPAAFARVLSFNYVCNRAYFTVGRGPKRALIDSLGTQLAVTRFAERSRALSTSAFLLPKVSASRCAQTQVRYLPKKSLATW
jgi:hypothetical protein